jgi:ubiquinone biosynthesis protein
MFGKRLIKLNKTYKHVKRYREILIVLLRYGFDDLIHSLKIDQYLDRGWRLFARKSVVDKMPDSRAERIRMVLEELGPAFIKMGQMLSTRGDVLPQDILEELAQLQDRVPAFPGDEAKRIIEQELEKPFDDIFLSFETEPLAAGSIGQVHTAVLKDGSRVVVKVRRPKIEKLLDVDLEIMHDLATLTENNLDLNGPVKPSEVVTEFEQSLSRELDFIVEAANMERFQLLFESHTDIYIPSVYHDYSTKRVLTLEYVEGIKPIHPEALRKVGLDPEKLARRGAELLLTQVFVHGFFHGDPHPGNMVILDGNIICFFDFGMMGRLDVQSRELFADLLISVVKRKESQTVDILLKLTHGHRLIDRPLLEREVASLIDQHLFESMKELHWGQMLYSVLELTSRHDLRIPAQFFMLIKAVSQVEDLGRRLDPEFDFAGLAEPQLRQLLRRRYHPKRLAHDWYQTGNDIFYLFKDLPGEIRELLKQAKQGKVRIEFEHVGLKPLRNTLNRFSDSLSYAIVLAAMIIGSSLMVLSDVPPLWNEIPIIGVIGFVVSGLLGFGMLRSISKNRER